MMTEPEKDQTVRINRELGAGGYYYATSPDIRGLLVVKPTLAELDAAIPQAIADLRGAI